MGESLTRTRDSIQLVDVGFDKDIVVSYKLGGGINLSTCLSARGYWLTFKI